MGAFIAFRRNATSSICSAMNTAGIRAVCRCSCRGVGRRDLMTDRDLSGARPPHAQPGLALRHGRRRRSQYKILPAVFWTLWEQALQKSWWSFCPLEWTGLLSLAARSRCRVSPTQPRSTTRTEYRCPHERNDARESPQNVRRSVLRSWWRPPQGSWPAR